MTDPFDLLVARFDTPLVIVTAAADELRGGCVVGFHGQCGITPARYAVRLSKANHTYRVALFTERLAVHALTAADRDLAERFGSSSGDDVDKFAGCELDGVDPPLLSRCPNRFVLRVRSMVDDGSDHVAFVGDVVDAAFVTPFEPLRLSGAEGIDAGHAATERSHPDDVSD